MNMQDQKKDFTEAKQVLNGLKKYVEEKIEKRNQIQEQAGNINDMSLASQPELPSDHLAEEAVLTPFDSVVTNANVEENNQVLDSTVPVEEVDNSQVLTETSEVVPVPETYVSSSIETPVSIPEVAPISTPPSAEGLNNNYAVDASEPAPVGEQIVEPTPQLDAPQESINPPAVGDVPTQVPGGENLQNNVNQNVFADSSIQAASQDLNQEVLSTVQIPAQANIDNGDLQQEVDPQQVPMTGTNDVIGMENIPEIVPPQSIGNDEVQGNYQATNIGAQASIADVTPAMSDANVIMPEGTTAEIANDQTLVVGPEAFTQTR